MCVCVCVCVCDQDLALNNPQGLICQSITKLTNQPKTVLLLVTYTAGHVRVKLARGITCIPTGAISFSICVFYKSIF